VAKGLEKGRYTDAANLAQDASNRLPSARRHSDHLDLHDGTQATTDLDATHALLRTSHSICRAARADPPQVTCRWDPKQAPSLPNRRAR